jgi:hypothetical protein
MLAESIFPGGCYRIRIRATDGGQDRQGTLRIDRSPWDDLVVASGDLYVCQPGDGAQSYLQAPADERNIPIYPRASYRSYLTVRSATPGPDGAIELTADEYLYAPPEPPNRRGSFPREPSRTIVLEVARGHQGTGSAAEWPRYEGRLLVGQRDVGVASLDYVCPYLRRAELHVHVAAGAVPPAPVPDGESRKVYFDTVFAASGWQLSVLNGQTDIPPPTELSPSGRWRHADLIRLFESVREPTLSQDRQWRVDLLVVPEGMDASLGVMFDDVGREAAASFSAGRYSTIESTSYGSAVGLRQSDVPRAYLRSALHEVTHAFNEIDQHRRAADDNSIMTTTPRLAEILADSSLEFPNGVRLAHNAVTRHHLIHLPDPVVRPGGWPFQSWCWGDVPGRLRRPLNAS